MFKVLGKIVLGLIYIVTVLVLLYVFVVQPNPIDGNSMMPTFENGEVLLTYKLGYKLGSPKQGDIAVFHAPADAHCPSDEKCDFVKRVIGLPGDSVMIRSGKVYVNGLLLEEEYIVGGLNSAKEITIPSGQYYVLGDNRPGSVDSRKYGFVDGQDFIGKAIFVIWPISNFRAIEK